MSTNVSTPEVVAAQPANSDASCPRPIAAGPGVTHGGARSTVGMPLRWHSACNLHVSAQTVLG